LSFRIPKAAVSFIACVLILVAGALIAIFGSEALAMVMPSDASVTEAAIVEHEAENVRVEVVEPTTVEDTLFITGRITAWVDVVLSAETSGRIEWKSVSAGDKVTEGQELFRIDTEAQRIQFAQAQARYRLAVQELERIERLGKGGISSEQAYDQALAERDQAKANLDAAQLELDRSIVRSPGDGVVDVVHKEFSEYVDVGMPLIQLSHVEKVRAVTGIPERDIRFMDVGDVVAIQVDALPEHTFQGSIVSIGSTANTETFTFLTEVALENGEGLLKPGMTARMQFVRRVFEDAVKIPMFAMITLENQHFVVVEEGGVAHLRPVTPGRVMGDDVHIVDGLMPGDRLIVAGHRDLRDGDPVRVVDQSAG